MSKENNNPNDTTEKNRAQWIFAIIAALLLLVLGLWIVLHWTEFSAGKDIVQSATATVLGDTNEEEPAGTATSTSDAQADSNQPSSENAVGWLGKFAEPPWQWLDWVLISLIGTLLYALTEVARWYPKASDSTDATEGNLGKKSNTDGDEQSAQFIKMTPWYMSTIIKGPLVAIAILVFLTNVSVDISGMNIDFTQLGAEVLLVIAFILGFYSRVAREQLNIIVKTLFDRAYSWAEESFEILTDNTKVVFGQTAQLKTSKAVEVTWLASVGKIEDGLYTAPAATHENVKSGQEVQITAVPKDPNIPRVTTKISLWPFLVTGPKHLSHGQTATYAVEGVPQSSVTWSVKPDGPIEILNEASGVIKVSDDEAKTQGVKNFTITAQTTDSPQESVSLIVALTSNHKPCPNRERPGC